MAWLVGRVAEDDITQEQMCDLAEWLDSLGIDPDSVSNSATISMDGDRYEVHLSRFVLDSRGRKVLDLNRNEIVTTPFIRTVAKDSWPSWLVSYGHDQES